MTPFCKVEVTLPQVSESWEVRRGGVDEPARVFGRLDVRLRVSIPFGDGPPRNRFAARRANAPSARLQRSTQHQVEFHPVMHHLRRDPPALAAFQADQAVLGLSFLVLIHDSTGPNAGIAGVGRQASPPASNLP